MACPPDGRYQNPDEATQLTLLTPGELAELQCPVSWSRKGEIRSCKERHQCVDERSIQRGALPSSGYRESS